LSPLQISLRRAKPLDILKGMPEDTVLLLSPKGTQQSKHESLELDMVSSSAQYLMSKA